MKKFLLLAAVVAPLFASAEVTDYVRYEMPVGTFYNGTTILLPPTTSLTWPNKSFYYDSSMMESYPLQSDFRWAVPVVNPFGAGFSTTYSTDSTLTTGTNYTALTPFTTSIKLPTLTDTFDSQSFSGVKDAAVYVGSAPTDIDFTTYNPNPDGMSLEMKSIPQFTMGAEDLDGMWSSETGDNSGFYVAGFAQKIDYPGAPYVLSGLTFNSASITSAGSITVSIYPFPGVGKALAEKPIYSETFSVSTGEVTSEMAFTNAVAITQTVVVTFTDITAQEFAPTMVVATQDENYPAPVNQGAYAVASYSNSDGTVDNALVEWTTPIAYDGEYQQIQSLPVALDINFNADYTFFQPIYVTSDDKPVTSAEDLTVTFDQIVSIATFRCVSSSPASYEDEDLITFTQPDGSELPDWIEAYATDPTAEEVAALAKQYGIDNVTATEARFLNVTITPVHQIAGDVQIKATVYGGANAIFTVHSTTSGIQAITSDAEIVAREYYDLAGRRLSTAPTSGFFIEKAIRADGTTTSSRLVR